jgi:predicted nucleic acid-binding protein
LRNEKRQLNIGKVLLSNEEILKTAYEISKFSVKSKDALHLACAIYLKCDYFITTDETIIKKMSSFTKIKVVNPIEFINKEVKDGN